MTRRVNHSHWRRSEWWRMPLTGLLIGAPISISSALYLATYGAGPYGSFWFLFVLGTSVSAPVFVIGGLFVAAPLEIWINVRPKRLRARYLAIARGLAYMGYAAVGALIAHAIVKWAFATLLPKPVPPPNPLQAVLLMTYSGGGIFIGFAYSLYDGYIYHLRFSSQLTQELQVARTIQKGLFPREYPQIPGFSLAARCQPANETGGDFYDFIGLQDGRLGVVIADVAGKGVPAAVLMADARSILRAEARDGHGPARVLEWVNRWMYNDTRADSFVTLLYAVLDPHERRLCLANAGHLLPMLYRPPSDGVREVEIYGLPLGLTPDATYEEIALDLQPGDTLLLYTDGVVEALSPDREMFGFDRLMQTLSRERHQTAEELVDRVLHIASAFSRGDGQQDDMGVMVLKCVKRKA